MSANCEIKIDCLKVINYAVQQNRIPFVRSIQVYNGTDSALENCRLRVSFMPEYAQDIEIAIGEIKAGAGLTLKDANIVFSGDYLPSMTERVVGQLSATLVSGEDDVCTVVEQIDILTFDEWPGTAIYPEIIASFVTPNHPAIRPIIKRASEILEKWNINGAIDAYYSNSPEKVKYLMAAIFEVVKEYRISYCWVPASYSSSGQRIRLAHTILADKLACCLDMACLYAGCLEAAGLNPIIVIQNDHAFAGCHLMDRLLQDPSSDDASLIMKLCAEGINEMMVVETTSMTEGCIRPFDEAVAIANSELSEIEKFHIAVDIRRSRLANILPLPLTIDGRLDPSLMTTEKYESLQPTKLGEIDEIDPDLPASVTKQHIWERHLLDLSLKNRLLNMRLSKESVQIMCTDLQELENAFSAGKSFRISHIPVEWIAAGVKPTAFHHISTMDPVRDLISTDIKQQRLHAFLNEEQMQSALKQLAYTSRTSMEECGANSLYLALGMLRLSDAETGSTIYAPIILYPVDLTRKSAASGYVVTSRGEDPVLNITLIEYLRQFYQIRIGGIDPLPRDGNGVDVSMVLNSFRKAVLHKKNWDIEEHAILGIFSFSKQVMWNDIHSNSELFETNPIVNSLKEGRLNPAIMGEKASADVGSGERLILPLDADSSQEAVIRAAVKGESFVIHGAPGTGKSQTITNIIANMLYLGKRVLFVAEKQAALDVVLKRLEAIGIADFCLPLHSNKTSKSSVLQHFKQLLGLGIEHLTVPFDEQMARFSYVEGELGNHVEAINRKHPAGYSLNDCISGYLSCDGQVIPGLDSGSWDAAALERLIGTLEDFKNACGVVPYPAEHPFTDSALTTLPTYDARPLMSRVISGVVELCEKYPALWNMVFPSVSPRSDKASIVSFIGLCEALVSWDPVNPDHLLGLNKEQLLAAKSAAAHGTQYQKTKKRILSHYHEEVLDNSCWELKNKLADVVSKDFIGRFIGELKLRDEIRAYTLSNQRPSIQDINTLANDIAKLDADGLCILEAESTLKPIFGEKWDAGYNNDWEAAISDLDNTLRIIDSVKSLTASESEYYQMVDDLVGFMHKKSQDVASEMNAFESVANQVISGFEELTSVLAIESSNEETDSWIESVKTKVEKWNTNYDSLRDWVIYNSNRMRVKSFGLGKIVELVENGDLKREDIEKCFMKSFYYSYANQIIASDPDLALFHGLIFEDKADKFRNLNEVLRETACAELRNHLLGMLPSIQQEAANGNEVSVLQKSIRNGCRGVSIRNLFSQIPNLLAKMSPCMLMSPLSVAQYLTADGPKFDLVIFDEASQVPTSEAIGAIARGNSVIVVGDPNQMPPSDFFTPDSFDEENAYIEDLESILDDCLALSMPARKLLWHYRSKHESLIAFSNIHFYENKLLTFPSIDDLTPRVHFQLVEGTYDRGRSRQNSAEADAIVEDIKQRLSNPDLADKSIGIVTFNTNQQSLIEDRLNDMFKKNPALEMVAMKQAEPIFVKNLENVQGDERDVILFSIGYGQDKNGFMSLNFGPLNKEGGWRRLNVAVSRARYEMKVFSTITADQIDLSRSSSEGVAGLKAFLFYAEKGREALRYGQVESADTDDGIVLSIADALKEKGFEVQTNIGCSGYRIDLGIVDPHDSGKYIAGILCDGYNYAAAKTTKDREVVQIKTLELLGWNICRVWALDYWTNRDKTVDRLVEQLKAIIDARKTSETSLEVVPSPEVLVQQNNSDLEETNTEQPSEEILDEPRNEIDVMEEKTEVETAPSEEAPGVTEDTDTIVKEMLEDASEYETKPYFKPIIEMLVEEGFRCPAQKVDDAIFALGEMPSAAINAINEAYYEVIGGNLILEEGEDYVIERDNYDKI